jgi:hypothetical protein
MKRMRWDPSIPISSWPEHIEGVFRDHALELERELIRKQLSVILIPAPETRHQNHKIRVAEQGNPDWYRHLWHAESYIPPRRRSRPASIIKRPRVQRSLARISQSADLEFIEHNRIRGQFGARYDTLLRNIIFERLQSGYKDDEYGYIGPHEAIQEVFGDNAD